MNAVLKVEINGYPVEHTLPMTMDGRPFLPNVGDVVLFRTEDGLTHSVTVTGVTWYLGSENKMITVDAKVNF